MRSKVLQRLMNQMEKDPWHVKLKRWYNLEKWVLICRTRKYWDKEYEHYIWRKRKQFIMWVRTTNGIEFIHIKQTIQGLWILKNTSS